MSSEAVSRTNAEHYTWGNGCDGWHLVRDPSLSVIEELMPADSSEARHYHERAQQFFYVLEGKATMEIDGQRLELSAGQGLPIPPGTRHQLRNESHAEVRFIVISQPPSHGDRVDD